MWLHARILLQFNHATQQRNGQASVPSCLATFVAADLAKASFQAFANMQVLGCSCRPFVAVSVEEPRQRIPRGCLGHDLVDAAQPVTTLEAMGCHGFVTPVVNQLTVPLYIPTLHRCQYC